MMTHYDTNPSMLSCINVAFCCAALLSETFSVQKPISSHASHTGSYWGRPQHNFDSSGSKCKQLTGLGDLIEKHQQWYSNSQKRIARIESLDHWIPQTSASRQIAFVSLFLYILSDTLTWCYFMLLHASSYHFTSISSWAKLKQLH